MLMRTAAFRGGRRAFGTNATRTAACRDECRRLRYGETTTPYRSGGSDEPFAAVLFPQACRNRAFHASGPGTLHHPARAFELHSPSRERTRHSPVRTRGTHGQADALRPRVLRIRHRFPQRAGERDRARPRTCGLSPGQHRHRHHLHHPGRLPSRAFAGVSRRIRPQHPIRHLPGPHCSAPTESKPRKRSAPTRSPSEAPSTACPNPWGSR